MGRTPRRLGLYASHEGAREKGACRARSSRAGCCLVPAHLTAAGLCPRSLARTCFILARPPVMCGPAEPAAALLRRGPPSPAGGNRARRAPGLPAGRCRASEPGPPRLPVATWAVQPGPLNASPQWTPRPGSCRVPGAPQRPPGPGPVPPRALSAAQHPGRWPCGRAPDAARRPRHHVGTRERNSCICCHGTLRSVRGAHACPGDPCGPPRRAACLPVPSCVSWVVAQVGCQARAALLVGA